MRERDSCHSCYGSSSSILWFIGYRMDWNKLFFSSFVEQGFHSFSSLLLLLPPSIVWQQVVLGERSGCSSSIWIMMWFVWLLFSSFSLMNLRFSFFLRCSSFLSIRKQTARQESFLRSRNLDWLFKKQTSSAHQFLYNLRLDKSLYLIVQLVAQSIIF